MENRWGIFEILIGIFVFSREKKTARMGGVFRVVRFGSGHATAPSVKEKPKKKECNNNGTRPAKENRTKGSRKKE